MSDSEALRLLQQLGGFSPRRVLGRQRQSHVALQQRFRLVAVAPALEVNVGLGEN